MKKKVMHIIEVPVGDYCRGDNNICEHYDNEGGCGSCDLGFYIENSDYPVKKPDKCKNLQDAPVPVVISSHQKRRKGK